MVAPERQRPAVEKLLVKGVLVLNVKAVKDLDLRPVTTSTASSVTDVFCHLEAYPA
jgi:hypothetical protein